MYEGWFEPCSRDYRYLTLARKLKILVDTHWESFVLVMISPLAEPTVLTLTRCNPAVTLVDDANIQINSRRLDELQDMLSGRQQNNDRLGPSLVDLEPVMELMEIASFGSRNCYRLRKTQRQDAARTTEGRQRYWTGYLPVLSNFFKTVSELLRNQRE